MTQIINIFTKLLIQLIFHPPSHRMNRIRLAIKPLVLNIPMPSLFGICPENRHTVGLADWHTHSSRKQWQVNRLIGRELRKRVHQNQVDQISGHFSKTMF